MYKKAESLVTVQDIEPLTLELLKHHKSTCQDFINQWDFWYIDEYQDTSDVQKEIFSFLLDQKPFFKVGDPQQSIYLFRGAQTGIFLNELDLAQDSSDIETLRLDTNYRSKPQLVLALNELFSYISSQSFKSMKPAQDDSSPTSQVHAPTPIIVYKMDEISEELDHVANDILEKIESGAKPEEFCILSQKKSILKDYEKALLEKNIPAIKWVSGSYAQRPEIQELQALVAFFMDPDNNEILFEVLRSPEFQVQPDEITLWAQDSLKHKSWSLWDYLLKTKLKNTSEKQFLKNESPKCPEGLDTLYRLKHYLDLASKKGIFIAIKSIVSETNFLYLGKTPLDQQRRQANTYKFLSQLYENHLDENFMEGFLGPHLSGSPLNEEPEASFKSLEQGVRLMTIHGSKGLEFDRVYVVGCGQKPSLSYSEDIELDPKNHKFSIPYKSAKYNMSIKGPLQKNIAESRIILEKQETLRLIYVAATRAKQELIFVGSHKNSQEKSSLFSYMNLSENQKFKYIQVIEKQKLSDNLEILPKIDKNTSETRSSQNPNLLSFKDNQQRQWDVDSFINTYQMFKKSPQNRAASTKNSLAPFTEPLSVSALVEVYKKNKDSFSYQTLKKTPIKYNNSSPFEHDPQTSPHLKSLNLYERLLYGNLVHKCFEMFFRGADKNFIRHRFSHTPLGDLSFTFSLCEGFQKLKDPPVKEMIKSQRPEWGFNAQLEDFLVSGQIDLWGQDSRGDIHIFDYKTGQNSPIAHGAIQLGLYAWVLKNRCPLSKIHTHLVQLSDLTIHTLDIQLKPISTLSFSIKPSR